MRKRNVLPVCALVVLLCLAALSSSAAWGEEDGTGAALAASGTCTDTIPEIYVGDFNKDGQSDLGVFRPDENTFYVLLSTGKRFGDSGSGQWAAPNILGHMEGQPYIGDYDGDRRSDLGFFNSGDNSFHVSLSTGRNFGGSGSGRWIAPNTFGHRNGQYFVAFFNGGLKSDLGFFDPTNNTFWVSLSTGSGFNAPHSGRWIGPNEHGHANGRYLIGDYNGDGSEDLGFFEPANNTFNIDFSDGTDFTGSKQWIPPNWFGHMDGQHYVGDYNGDGKADLGFFEPADNTFHVTISTGSAFGGSGTGEWVAPNHLGHRGGQYFIGDFNGGGKSDLGFFDPADFSFYVGLSTRAGFDFKGSGYWANLRLCRSYLPLNLGKR